MSDQEHRLRDLQSEQARHYRDEAEHNRTAERHKWDARAAEHNGAHIDTINRWWWRHDAARTLARESRSDAEALDAKIDETKRGVQRGHRAYDRWVVNREQP